MATKQIIFKIDELLNRFYSILSANTRPMKLNTIMIIAAGNNMSPDSVEAGYAPNRSPKYDDLHSKNIITLLSIILLHHNLIYHQFKYYNFHI